MIIEPGVYRDKPTGAILLILGMTRLGPSENDPNFLDLVDLVVLALGDLVHEWKEVGVRIQALEEVFDDSYRDRSGKIMYATCLERIV
jgi:hypothetical protein